MNTLPESAECCRPCCDTEEVAVPGPAGPTGATGSTGSTGLAGSTGATGAAGATGATGANGSNGTNGKNAFTVTTSNTTQPTYLGTRTFDVADSSWIGQGQTLFLETGGFYEVTAIPNATQVTLRNLDDNAGAYPDNAPPATALTAPLKLSPGGVQGPIGVTGATGTNSNAGSNAFSVHKNGTDQDQSSGGTGVQVTFASALFDADAVFDLTSDEWTAPATGLYRFNLQISYALKSGSAVAMECYARLYKNGAPGVGTLVGLNFFDSNAEAFDFYTITVDKVLSLTAGDTIQVNSFATYNDAGNVYEIDGTATETWLEGCRVA